MISWLKKFFKKEVKKTTYAPKSSMKEVLEELINSGCSVREFPAKDYKTVWQVVGIYVAVFVISLHIYFRSV